MLLVITKMRDEERDSGIFIVLLPIGGVVVGGIGNDNHFR